MLQRGLLFNCQNCLLTRSIDKNMLDLYLAFNVPLGVTQLAPKSFAHMDPLWLPYSDISSTRKPRISCIEPSFSEKVLWIMCRTREYPIEICPLEANVNPT